MIGLFVFVWTMNGVVTCVVLVLLVLCIALYGLCVLLDSYDHKKRARAVKKALKKKKL